MLKIFRTGKLVRKLKQIKNETSVVSDICTNSGAIPIEETPITFKNYLRNIPSILLRLIFSLLLYTTWVSSLIALSTSLFANAIT